ncbi:AarF/ABC1/UbiB kinase family protein [Rhodocyclus tenuis]|uniref:AarF/ABC1/UbiB kinase family protein n=2 Tax=Rhodocyclus TaxID=1064 RepID=A0A6L5JY05_RHOTE|nr:AarF/ABC1/UbiB kinase family protein [Rhodocyclus gracilis]MQY52215.1 AarF/ABC1/UbiB kinase family protein [Rhodocyclus gracilis]MRD72355.1 AarF/ABC1/UbiB kinase family protein [Rhodocyclus gracilis]NJA89559.1 AarF/ABC1/UbiB kinase family protein [Rhodocyclus gracilis]
MTDDDTRASAPVPRGRRQRFLHLGRAVGEMAVSAAADGIAQLARGERPQLSQLMLTPDNARRLADRLSKMRGAAMKVGQLMSMDGKDVLPPEFAQLLAGLRDSAHVMPLPQLATVLEEEWGSGWESRFRRFSFNPIAAASIGQVHRAETADGRTLAIKIQYPGVRDSIDSDIANIALLTRLPGLVPPGWDVAPLLERVRQQLYEETDYVTEAASLTAYRAQLGDDPLLHVPALYADLSTPRILATDFAAGESIDQLMSGAHSQALRDRVAEALTRLALRELFEFRLMQTDPNFANYLYDSASDRISLLDFGATQAIAEPVVDILREMARALRAEDRPRIRDAAAALGFIGAEDSDAQANGVVDIVLLSGEPLRTHGRYDFGNSDLFGRVYANGRDQYREQGFPGAPPADIMLLQRKFAGVFLLASRLRARIDIGRLFDPYL